MAEEDEEEAPPPADGMGQTLDQFRNLYPSGDGQEWAQHVSQTINNYVQQRQIGEANQAAGQAFQDNIARFGQGLTGLVQDDPAAVDTAISLVRPTIATMVKNVPGHPADLYQPHYEAISGELEGNIVQAAVRSAAQRDAGTARSILDSKADLLPEGAADQLGAYIDVQHNARNLDQAAAAQAQEQVRQVTEQQSSWNYLGALIDPTSGDFRPMPNWTQKVLNDPRVGPQASAQLIDKYGELLQNGDAPQSNPYLAHTIAQQLVSDDPPGTSDVIAHMGRGLTAADALAFAAGTMPQTAAGKREYEQLAATLDTAKRTLAAPEYGPAGDAAFSRFVKWLMPAYRDSGPGSLSPGSDNNLLPFGDDQGIRGFWNQFAPRLDDVITGTSVLPGWGGNSNQTDNYNRHQDKINLRDIFGERTQAPAGDQVIPTPRPPLRSKRHMPILLDGPDMGGNRDNPTLEGPDAYPYNAPKDT